MLRNLVALILVSVLIHGLVPQIFPWTIETDSKVFGRQYIVGPEGGDVRSIAIDPKNPDRLYISTLDGQIYTSADAGKTWKFLVNFGVPLLIIDDLMVDVEDSNIIYASGHRHKEPGGFFKSTDGGLTWKASDDLKNEAIHAMVQSTLDPNIIIVGGVNGIFISRNRGKDFKKIDSPTAPRDIDSLAIDPTDTNIIYAGTTWRPYKTTDGGQTWRLIKQGLIDDSDVFAIEIDDRDPNHVIASACSGIYESFNKGENWKKIQGIPSTSRRTRDIKINPARPESYYAATTEGFWVSDTAGKSWRMTTSRDLEVNSIAVHRNKPDRIFIATNNYGVLVSNDGGKNFTPTNGNFTSRFTLSIVPDNEKPNRLYAITRNTATGGGFLFVSENAGNSWYPSMKGLVANRIEPRTIFQSRLNPSVIYLGTNVGLFKSQDRGNSWSEVIPSKPPVRPQSRRTKGRKSIPAVTTKSTDKIQRLTDQINILVGTVENGKEIILAGTDSGLYKTDNVANGWEKVYLSEKIEDRIYALTISPRDSKTIWVGTASSGLFVSRDGSETWEHVKDIPKNLLVGSIVVNPSRPEYVYVGTKLTFFLSRDGGKTWIRRGGNLPIGDYRSIIVNPNDPNEVLVASAMEKNGGIYRSTDAGMTWKRLDPKDANLPSQRYWSMIFNPSNPNELLVGTHSSGVYKIELLTPSANKKDSPDKTAN